MGSKERFIIEILAGVVLISFLILILIAVINATEDSGTKTIVNSYNTYNINNEPVKTYSSLKPYIIDRGDYTRIYYLKDKSKEIISDRRYLEYDSRMNYKVVKGIVGNDIKKYEVFVFNKDYTGGYFKVIYTFEDYYGNVNTESMTHYIGPREKERFVLRHVSPSKYDYKRWWYEVSPLTKAPARVYYNNDEKYIRTYSRDYPTRTYSYVN